MVQAVCASEKSWQKALIHQKPESLEAQVRSQWKPDANVLTELLNGRKKLGKTLTGFFCCIFFSLRKAGKQQSSM